MSCKQGKFQVCSWSSCLSLCSLFDIFFCFCCGDGSLLVLVSVFPHHLVHHLFTNHPPSFWQLQKVDSFNSRIHFFWSCEFIRPKNELKKERKGYVFCLIKSIFWSSQPTIYKKNSLQKRKKTIFGLANNEVFFSIKIFKESIFWYCDLKKWSLSERKIPGF